MLLFYIRKTKKEKPKVMIVFEPDEDFETQFTKFVGEILNCAREKKAKSKTGTRICVPKTHTDSRKEAKIPVKGPKTLQFTGY